MKRINITQAAAVFGVAGLLGVASLAIAGDQKPAVKPATPAMTDPASLPKFDHVVVVNATPQQLAALASHRATTVGQMAAVDPVTKQLRPLVLEDYTALTPAPEASSAAPGAIEFTTPDGLKGAQVGDESMSYAVAHVGEDGKVRQACLDGQANDKAALKAAAALTGVQKNDK